MLLLPPGIHGGSERKIQTMTTKTVIVLTTLSLTAFSQAQRYSIQPSDSNRAELRVYKTGLYSGKVHTFVFPKYQGSLTFNAHDPAGSQVHLTLSAPDMKLTDTWLSVKDFKSVQEYGL